MGEDLPCQAHGLAKGQRKHTGRKGIEGATVPHAFEAELVAHPSRDLVGGGSCGLVQKKNT